MAGAGLPAGGGGLSSPVGASDGGTGATSLTDGGVLLGSGTGAVTAMSVLADGAIIVGDGTTDPVAESGATALTSLGAMGLAGGTFTGSIALDTKDISTDTTTGTKVGTGTTQKLAFWNATPVVQPGHIIDPDGGANVAHSVTDGGETLTRAELNGMLNQLGTKINSNADALDAILSDLAELGLQASS